MRILVVDDDETNRLVVRLLMELRGFGVLEAESGANAVRVLEDEEVDAILMDIQMPDLDGFGTTALIRQEKKLADVPVLALTSFVSDDVRLRCRECGMNGLMRKPFDAILAAEMSDTLERHTMSGSASNPGWLVG